MFPSSRGDEYNPEAPYVTPEVRVFPSPRGMSIIVSGRLFSFFAFCFRPLAGMSIIFDALRCRSDLISFPSPRGDEYNQAERSKEMIKKWFPSPRGDEYNLELCKDPIMSRMFPSPRGDEYNR